MKTENEIMTLAEDYAKYIDDINGTACFDFFIGYTRCQEHMADKKYTKEDLREAFKQSRQAKIFEKDMPPVYKSFEEWFEQFKKK